MYHNNKTGNNSNMEKLVNLKRIQKYKNNRGFDREKSYKNKGFQRIILTEFI